ncbi:MAG TPA: VIT domain-containing protein [Longimicrobium sp.]
MRIQSMIYLLVVCAPARAAAQAMVVAAGCAGECRVELDSVRVAVDVRDTVATTYVDHDILNHGDQAVDGALFFPIPRGATILHVSVYEGATLERYDVWSTPAESRSVLATLMREGRNRGLRAYAGLEVVHVPVPSIPARGSQRVRITYLEMLRPRSGALAYRYPLTTGAPPRRLALRMTVRTEHGFRDFASPSHPVEVTWGSEGVRCPPRYRCGWMGATSRRVKHVRLDSVPATRRRDFVLRFTPAASASELPPEPGWISPAPEPRRR